MISTVRHGRHEDADKQRHDREQDLAHQSASAFGLVLARGASLAFFQDGLLAINA